VSEDYISRHRYCTACGTEAGAAFSFCGACGKSLLKPTARSNATASGPSATSDMEQHTREYQKQQRRAKWQQRREARSPLWRALCWLFFGGIALVALGTLVGAGTSQEGLRWNVALGICWVGYSSWFLIFCILTVVFFRSLGHQATIAIKPIPSPAEISVLLEQEWGRPATVEEVAAVHQMLSSRRNEAAGTAGLGLGALYLMNKQAHGK
jgi:hypothetical protein